MYKSKEEKGIALITLAVTIIILLILSGVAIGQLTGTGIFDNAKLAKEKAEISTYDEQLKLSVTETKVNENGKEITVEDCMKTIKENENVNITDEQDEDGNKLITIDGKYVFEIKEKDEESNNEINVKYIGKVEEIEPKIEIESISNTTNSITVKVSTRRNKGGKIEYYIKKEDEKEYKLIESKTEEIYTYTELEQETKYNIKIVAVASNQKKVEVLADRITKKVPELTKANITFTYLPEQGTWTNGSVTATVSTTVEGFILRTSKDGKKWDTTSSQKFDENGTIYVVLWDGTNYGGSASGNVTNIDTLKPKDFTPTATSTTKSITVTASTTDEEKTSTNGSSGIEGYRFKLDNGEWTSYQESGTYTWNNLTQTTNHTITVEAKDKAGNTKQGTVTKGTGTIVTAGTATYTPTSWTNGKVTVTLPTESGFTTRYTTNGTAPTTSSTEYTAPFTVSSNCTITYIYTDGTNIGKSGSANITNIDTLKPKDFTPTATSTTKSITVTASTTDEEKTSTNGSSGIEGYRFKLDSGEWTSYQESGTYTWNNLTQTTNHTITVEAKDKAGNTKQGTVTKGTGTIVTAGTATYTPTSWTNGKVTVTLPTESGFTTRYTTNGTAPTTSSTEYTAPFTVSSNCTITYIYTDGTNIGKSGSANITNIDTLKPKDFTPTATSTTKSITVTASTTDEEKTSTNGSSGIEGYRFKLDNGEWTSYQESGTYTWNNLTQTTNHTITVEAKDKAGNTKQGTVTKGTGTIVTAGTATYTPTSWTNGKVTVTLPTESGFTTRYTTNGTAPTTSSTEYTAPFTVSSNCTITYIYTDGTNIGKSGSANITNIDKDAPSTPTITAITADGNSYTSGNWTSQNVTITASSSDSASKVKELQYSYDQSTWKTDWGTDMTTSGNTSTISGTWASNYNTTIYVRAIDNAGNTSGTSSIVLREDKAAPTMTSAEIKNVTSTGYDVYIYGVQDSGSGVNRVQFPTWTANGGQDDIQSSWTTSSSAKGTKQSDGTTWKFHVNVTDHKNESGTYYTHIYVYDNVGNSNCISTHTITVPSLANYVSVGDYVAYNATNNYSYTSPTGSGTSHGNGNSSQTFTSSSSIKWRVFSKNSSTGEVVLISESPIGSFSLKGAVGYLYAEQELNNICAIYGHGSGANTGKKFSYYIGDTAEGLQSGTITGSGARSIKIEDINSITGYTPSIGSTQTVSAALYPTRNTSTGYVSATVSRKYTDSKYLYQPEKKLDNSTIQWKILFGGTDKSSWYTYWISNRTVAVSNNNANFNAMAAWIVGGSTYYVGTTAAYSPLFYPSGNTPCYGFYTYGVRPLVYLKTTTATSGKNSSGQWTIVGN